MRRVSCLAAILCLLLPTHASAAPALGPDLRQRLASLDPAASVPVILNFADRVDLGRYHGSRAAAGELIASLRDRAERSQARVLSYFGARGLREGARSLWINNSIAVRVPSALLSELASFPEVENIDYDEPVGFDGTESGGGGGSFAWNIAIVRANDVWSGYGLDGSGVVVGSMDTGFDPNHPALQGKWRGGAHSWIDIINGLPSPYDDHGHGTHTIGTMVGGDGPGPFAQDIGVAYNARFISAKVLDQTNSFSSASIVIAGAQWMLDPDGNALTDDFPAVVNNSWFFFSQTYTGFHSTVDAWRAAGIIPVFCIGNSGPAGATTRAPANYDNTLGIGAIDSGDLIASFSSRGPSPSGSGFPIDLRKPDLSAPGALVLSSVPGGGYQQWSGTSMAAPHVAGTIALMLQGNPNLSYDGARSRLISSAVDRGAAGYDYDYGYGRLDAFAAVTQAITGVAEGAARAGLRLQSAPNPFGSRVRLDYAAARDGQESLDIFDAQGRRVWSARPSGLSGSLAWDGRDFGGNALPSGVYLVRFSDGREATTTRLLHLR